MQQNAGSQGVNRGTVETARQAAPKNGKGNESMKIKFPSERTGLIDLFLLEG